MATVLGDSSLGDHFRRSSLLHLLPKTLGPLSRARSAVTEAEELESIDKVLKSMALTSVADARVLESVNKANKSMDHPQERRPALGRKRAKFSLKPVPSPSLPNIDFISSLDHIDDPEEYFSAFEQLENAEKEIKKLRGEASTETVRTNQLRTTRKRRPGLLGKTASYKHHTSANVDTSGACMTSQEEHLNGRLSSSSETLADTGLHNLFHSEPADETCSSQAKDRYTELQDAMESEGSVIENKNFSSLLDKLLISFKDYDGDEGDLLRESLRLKPINKGEFHLPELENFQLSQYSAQKKRVALGELKGSQISSPTKSPLGAISALHRHVSLKDPLKDVYFGFRSDDAPCSKSLSPSKKAGKLSVSPVTLAKYDSTDFLCDGTSPIEENGTKLHFENDGIELDGETDRFIDSNILKKGKPAEHPHPLCNSSANPDSNIVFNYKGSLSVGFDSCSHEMAPVTTDEPDARVEGLDLSGSKQPRTQDGLEDPFQSQAEPLACVQIPTSSCPSQSTTKSLASPPSRNMGVGCSTPGRNFKTGFSQRTDTSQSEADGRVQEEALDAGTPNDNLHSSEVTRLADEHLGNAHSLPHEDNEVHSTSARSSSNKKKKQKAPRVRKSKNSISRRQSFGSAGTKWEDGRRRSTRRKFKPLEHWRGERLLHARIHDSLATVIGVRYVEGGSVKVESYVPEEYADLVALSAR